MIADSPAALRKPSKNEQSRLNTTFRTTSCTARIRDAVNRAADAFKGTLLRRLANATFYYALAVIALFAIMLVFRHLSFANETTAGFVFLLAVLVTAAVSGFGVALTTAVAATLMKLSVTGMLRIWTSIKS